MIKQISFFFFTIVIAMNINLQLRNTRLTKKTINTPQIKRVIQDKFPQPNTPIEQINFINVGIDIEGMKFVLQHNLTNLQKINFNRVRMNTQISKTFFSQEFIPKLDTLILENCHLVAQDLESLQNKNVQWKNLSLLDNLIQQKGFQYLGNINANLTTLKLSKNSLASQQAVSNLIKIGLKYVQNLYLEHVSISHINLLKILDACNTSILTNLTIGVNNFPKFFYEKLVEYQFDNLKFLDLNALLIDENAIDALQKWELPKLQLINFSNNQLRTTEATRFFTKSRMPNLNSLILAFTPIDSEFFRHLKNQQFVFKKLLVDIPTLRSKSLQYMAEMNMTQLQQLTFLTVNSIPQHIYTFFKNANLTCLKQLQIKQFTDNGNILKTLINTSLPQLQTLALDDPGQISIQQLQNTNLLRKLKTLQISFEDKNFNFKKAFLKQITKIAPKLQKLTMNGNQLQQEKIYQLFYKQQIKLNSDIYLDLFNGRFKLYMHKNNKKAQPKNVDWLFIKRLYKNLLLETKQQQTQKLTFQELQQKVNNHSTSFTQRFDLSNMTYIKDDGNISLLNKLLPSQQLYNHFTNSIQQIILQKANETSLQVLSKYKYPQLIKLSFKFDEQFQKKFKDSSIVLANLQDLAYLHLYANQQSQNLCEWMVRSINPQRLMSLTLSGCRIYNQNFQQIKKSIANYERLSELNLDINNLKDLAILNSQSLKLGSLSLNMNSISSNLLSLCSIDMSFMQYLSLDNCQIDNSDFIKFLQCKNQEQPFPRLRELTLSSNYIETEGFQKLFDLGLPLLLQININGNMDPEFFNTIFQSKYSKRIAFFSSYSNYIESISADIQSANTRRLLKMELNSDSLRDSDFQIIRKLQFQNLVDLSLILKKIQNCETLKTIREMSRDIEVISIFFSESQPLLTPKCLKQEDFVKEIRPISVIFGGLGYYENLQPFISSFVNQYQNPRQLIIEGPGCPTQQKFLKLLNTSELRDLNILALIYCQQLTDAFASQLFSKKLQVLQALVIKNSQYITADGLQTISGTFYSLINLDLSRTSIGDQGIKHLTKCSFPQLQQLSLVNIGITSKGLEYLNEFNAPLLTVIDLSCNDLGYKDLQKLDLSLEKFPILQAILLYPIMSDEEVENIKLDLNRFRKNRQINIITDIQHIASDEL